MTARPRAKPRLLTVPEAAKELGVSKMQVYRWINSGAIACVIYPTGTGQANGPKRIEDTAIEAFIASCRKQATA